MCVCLEYMFSHTLDLFPLNVKFLPIIAYLKNINILQTTSKPKTKVINNLSRALYVWNCKSSDSNNIIKTTRRKGVGDETVSRGDGALPREEKRPCGWHLGNECHNGLPVKTCISMAG